MKRKSLFLVLITILIISIVFSLLTACEGEKTVGNLKDDHGIIIEGGSFEEGATIVSKEIELTSEEGRNVLEAIKDQEYDKDGRIYVYDISVELDGVKVQPSGKVRVTVPAPNQNMTEYIVFHIKGDNSCERLSATCSDGNVSFETDSFSIFVLVTPVEINHVHTFSGEWSSNEYVHWHPATCEHSEERGDENEHDWDEGTEIKPATEKEDGEIKYVCLICGHEKTEPIVLHKHTFSSEWTPSETHHWHAATCEHTELVDSYEEHYYDAHGWSVEKPATETETGVKVRACIGCKYEDREVIPKLDHAHKYSDDWTSDGEYHWHQATCEHTGEINGKALCSGGNATCTKRAICSICGNEYGDTLSHDFTAKVRTKEHLATPATCQAHATYYYSCKGCGANGTETFEDTTGKFAYCTYDESEICTVCEIPAGDWLNFELRSDGESYKVARSQAPYSRHIQYLLVPSTYKGKPVVELAAQALYFSNGELVHLVLPDSIQIIRNTALPANLEVLEIGAGLKTIEEDSLGYGTGAGEFLRQITISEENPYFKMVDGIMYTMDGKTLVKYPAMRKGEEFTVGSNVEKIWSYAFEKAQNLKSVVIPDNVTSIMHHAFYCAEITSIDIGLGIETISENTFALSNLNSVKLEGNIKTIENYAFCSSTLKTVTFGTEVISIGDCAFENCYDLTAINLPDNIKTLGIRAFQSTNKVASIVIGNGIEEIPDSAFENSTINVANPTLTVGSNVKTIGEDGFRSLNISSVTIPASVKTIGNSAFRNCEKLVTIIIPNTVESLDIACFQDCKALESVTLSNQLTEISSSLFYCCQKLTSISIPASVKTIGESAFFACTSLETVNFGTGLKTICRQAFENCFKLVSITLPDGLEEVEHNVFKGCSALETVFLPSSINKISSVTFNDCTVLKSVTFKGTTDKEMYFDYGTIYTYTFDTVEKTISMLSGKIINREFYLYTLAAYNKAHTYSPITSDTKVEKWEERETA